MVCRRCRGAYDAVDMEPVESESGEDDDDGDTESSHTCRSDDDNTDADSADCDEKTTLEVPDMAQREEGKVEDCDILAFRALAHNALKEASKAIECSTTTAGVSNAEECLNAGEGPKAAAQGAMASDTAYKRSAEAAASAVRKLSTLSRVYEYVELARCFAPAASGGGEEIYERLKTLHENMWLGGSSSGRNPVGRFSEAEELARAFERQICANESLEELAMELEGVGELYARARSDQLFWDEFVQCVADIYFEEEARRARKAAQEVMGRTDMEKVVELPRVEDAVEYVEILRRWNGLTEGGHKFKARVGKLKERVARQWREHNADKQPYTGESSGAKELAQAMRRQIVACQSRGETAAFLEKTCAGYLRAKEDKQWWDEFCAAAIAISDVELAKRMLLRASEQDMQTFLELPRMQEAREYIELLRHWHGLPDGLEEYSTRIKDEVARKWVRYHRHKPPVPAEPPSKQSEAEHLAVALTERIALCESLEEMADGVAVVQKGYTRRQGDEEWWISFHSMI